MSGHLRDTHLVGIDPRHVDGYIAGMKAESLWAISVVAAFALACALPAVDPMEAQAAQAVAGAPPSCENTGCLAGWTAAQDAEISDAADCHRVASAPEEVAGCWAFVQWAHDQDDLQALAERGL